MENSSDVLKNLGIEEIPKCMPKAGSRIAVALSGGVDSGVVAALLKFWGYDVVAITLEMCETAAVQTECARDLAKHMEMEHIVKMCHEDFRHHVIQNFIDTYKRGQTPSPCCVCNHRVKFANLLPIAKSVGAEVLCTGHYVMRTEEGKACMHRGEDSRRDQSYFLFAITQDTLEYLRFPVGNFSKDQTRDLAEYFGLPVAQKPSTRNLCFTKSGHYHEWIREALDGKDILPGEIVDLEGNVLGQHRGIAHYTVGQRKGLDISTANPVFVLAIDAEKNRVIVGSHAELEESRVIVTDVTWLHKVGDKTRCQAKIRACQQPVDMTLNLLSDENSVELEFDTPQYGVAPGQACVLYDGSHVLGGGWIVSRFLENIAAVS